MRTRPRAKTQPIAKRSPKQPQFSLCRSRRSDVSTEASSPAIGQDVALGPGFPLPAAAGRPSCAGSRGREEGDEQERRQGQQEVVAEERRQGREKAVGQKG